MNSASPPRPSFRTIAASLLLAPLCAAPAQAAQIAGVTGTWGSKLNTHFKISGYGTHKTAGDGNCAITLQNEFSAGFNCAAFNTASGQLYSGTLSALVRRTKLGWSLDDAGIAQLETNMTQWLVAKNLKKGKSLDPSKVGYTYQRLDYKPIKLSNNLSKPSKGTATIKGQVTQLINDKYIIKKFSYQIGIQFLSRAP